ncbi:MAG: hypothetical protein K0R20_2048 [Actinomycetia bacterium]|jgi:hypothetical protein|nr:hypothetical protein [Actinomycetes bacterium]
MDIGEQRRTIYVEPIEEPLDKPSGEPVHGLLSGSRRTDPLCPDEGCSCGFYAMDSADPVATFIAGNRSRNQRRPR